MSDVICPACGHVAQDHRRTTLVREKPWRKPIKTAHDREEGVCRLSKRRLKQVIKMRQH